MWCNLRVLIAASGCDAQELNDVTPVRRLDRCRKDFRGERAIILKTLFKVFGWG